MLLWYTPSSSRHLVPKLPNNEGKKAKVSERGRQQRNGWFDTRLDKGMGLIKGLGREKPLDNREGGGGRVGDEERGDVGEGEGDLALHTSCAFEYAS
ncbi:hypothetical protein VNO78_03610 [Psophocarpus tetragonolobus]|uniref:Uncharacterized protein n=1 Tax=Psophocarpus tetragonolobus TaxID=3891 RepID=A0AAN9T0U5_PSOTE